MRWVYEVYTVERVERRYLVEFTDEDVAYAHMIDKVTDEDRKVYAEEQVKSGEITKFTEGDADFDEVIDVREQIA